VASANTPRVRLITAYYVLLVVANAVTAPADLTPMLDVLLSVAAFLLVLLAALGRLWCSVFIAGRKDVELVTSGPYALCRHPLYALSIAGGVGLGLATGSILLTLITSIVLAMLLIPAALAEERTLLTRFGSTFADYAAQVPRWWPRLTDWHVPADVHVRSDILWKAFLDAGSFLLLYALIIAAGALRATGVTPTLIALP
jgi:protein-S-isoprenylcysteine O-methyltransferase Ste14